MRKPAFSVRGAIGTSTRIMAESEGFVVPGETRVDGTNALIPANVADALGYVVSETVRQYLALTESADGRAIGLQDEPVRFEVSFVIGDQANEEHMRKIAAMIGMPTMPEAPESGPEEIRDVDALLRAIFGDDYDDEQDDDQV